MRWFALSWLGINPGVAQKRRRKGGEPTKTSVPLAHHLAISAVCTVIRHIHKYLSERLTFLLCMTCMACLAYLPPWPLWLGGRYILHQYVALSRCIRHRSLYPVPCVLYPV